MLELKEYFTNLFIPTNDMKKSTYKAPLAEISEVMAQAVICASNQGTNEDFNKGTGFSFDLFEGVKPF